MSDPVLVAVISAAALIVSTVISTLLARPSKKRQEATQEAVETAVQQTKHTSNGFARHVRSQLRVITDRLTDQDRVLYREARDRRRRDSHVDEILTNFDNRLTHIEEKQ